MAKALYFLITFLESFLSVFGVRSVFEQPPYKIVATLGSGIEIRAYGPLVAVETRADDGGFGRLFRYITGANGRGQLIAMTAPVEERGGPPGRLAAVDTTGEPVMRFFLPSVIAANPPTPQDPRIRVTKLPARMIATIRFSGRIDRISEHAAKLKAVLAEADRKSIGPAYVLGYDPPFTIPFLRRNEVAIDLAP